MIQFNLRERNDSHMLSGRFGVILNNTRYGGYPVTVVDNHLEVVDGKYTHERSLCLMHLAEDVRQQMRLSVFEDFLYLNFAWEKPSYRMYPYEKVNLTTEQIVHTLKMVFYYHQPLLQAFSAVGTKSKRLEDNPNYYEGTYVLNDEETYTILKYKTTIKFYRGEKEYSANWSDSADLLFEGEIDFELYAATLEMDRLRGLLVTKTNQMLDNGDDWMTSYHALKANVDDMVKERILVTQPNTPPKTTEEILAKIAKAQPHFWKEKISRVYAYEIESYIKRFENTYKINISYTRKRMINEFLDEPVYAIGGSKVSHLLDTVAAMAFVLARLTYGTQSMKLFTPENGSTKLSECLELNPTPVNEFVSDNSDLYIIEDPDSFDPTQLHELMQKVDRSTYVMKKVLFVGPSTSEKLMKWIEQGIVIENFL